MHHGRQAACYNRLVLTVGPLEHHPATGAPTIGGTLEVGETLTADTSGIADGDGMTGATFSYQWVSYEGATRTDIQGATELHVHPGPGRRGKGIQGEGVVHRRRRLRGIPDQRAGPLGAAVWVDRIRIGGFAVTLTWKLPVEWSAGSTFQILRNRPELGETEPLVHVRYHDRAAGTSYIGH